MEDDRATDGHMWCPVGDVLGDGRVVVVAINEKKINGVTERVSATITNHPFHSQLILELDLPCVLYIKCHDSSGGMACAKAMDGATPHDADVDEGRDRNKGECCGSFSDKLAFGLSDLCTRAFEVVVRLH